MMTTETSLSTEPISIDDLVARSADLKGELVKFAQSRRFARQLDARFAEAADGHGYLSEETAVWVIDHFALQDRLAGGRTLPERFIAQRRPRLSDVEQEMVLGWRDVIEAFFEVRQFDGDAVLLHNLFDDLVYRVYSNMGRGVFAKLRKGMFVVGRIVPVHPSCDAWLVSGHFVCFPKSARRQIAQSAAQKLITRPGALRRNPALLRRSWEIQAEQRANFVDLVGSDVLVLPPAQAQATLREHYRRIREATAKPAGKFAKPTTGVTLDELTRWPEDLLEAESVALIYDEVEGLNFYRDFGRLDALFADPSLASDRTRIAHLREYLHDESVSPLAIRRLVQRHPDGADPVFRALLSKPGFSWPRDGEKLLRRHKKSYFDQEPTPSITTVGDRLAELLGKTR
ncbi:hypothetical protein [Saccharopolyspora spinosa]|uniref:Uncharacterized protein n=2 Tax=Saccharopolyspora spinosa TaxID=60894 RepID=A0A2N3Y8K7_SACSN|nr:hypothetical protein [Saccharopolyspora spinosa]PKW19248.1 hypothetical protein A8926_7411 [Saccharopolyspora spinosa]